MDTERGLAPDNVAQPPSAVSRANPASSTYQRNLPHIQRTGKTLFVTFATWHAGFCQNLREISYFATVCTITTPSFIYTQRW
jgi:hypothetical protein